MRDWKKVKLGDLLTESRIVSEKPDANKRLTVRLHTEGIEKRPYSKDKKGATRYYIRSKGQFIYGRQNLHKGAFGIVPEELDGFESSADIPAFDVDKSCLPDWVHYFFKKGNFYLKLEVIAKGVGSKRINPSQIYDLDILLPTIEEQESLLEKVADLTKKYDKAKSEFAIQLEYINQLKQSIFDDAITGKLSIDWRNKNKSIDTAYDLLDKIVSDNEIHQKTNSNVDIEKPYNIPQTWAWCKLEQLILEKPRNGYSPKGVNYITNTRSLKLSATTKGVFDDTQIKYIEEDIHKDSYLWLKNGDILIQRSNSLDYVGISAIYNGGDDEFIYPDLMVKIRVANNMSEFVHICLNSQVTRNYFRKNANGVSSSMPKINQMVIQNTPIPLPPLEEQKIIISQVKAAIKNCEELEQETRFNIQNSQRFYDIAILNLLGDNFNSLNFSEIIEKNEDSIRNVKFDNKTMLMDLVELLQKHGKLYAEDLWRMSKFPENIDAFYAELKYQIEDEKSIKEVENEKGYLELV